VISPVLIDTQDKIKNKRLRVLVVTMHSGPIRTDKKVKNINIVETVKLSELLKKEGHEVTIATIYDTDVGVAYDKLDINSFDKVIIMNAPIDFFGGEENKYVDTLFTFLKPYKKELYYLMVDLALPFKQLYPLIKNRKWCKYKSQDEIYLDNDIIVISQAQDLKEVKEIHKKVGINIKKALYVPFNEWIFHTNGFVENTANVDLILGTSNRGGRRRAKYTDYFYGRDDLKVEFFGSISEKDFDQKQIRNLAKPMFTPRLDDCRDMIKKNATGFATVIIGDKNYNNNMVTLRVGESLLANCVTFIDDDFDTQHTIYPNYNFFYVKSGRELEAKIKDLKNNPELHKRVLEIQHELVNKYIKKDMPKLLSEVLYK